MENEISIKKMREYYPNGGLAASLHMIPNEKVIYVRNPKAGCSTIIQWMHRIHTGDNDADLKNAHRGNELPRPKEIGWRKFIETLSGEGFVFTFVRHPIERATSAYKDKIERNISRIADPLRRILDIPANSSSPLTPDQFVEVLEIQPRAEMDVHLRPQHMNLMHGLLNYSHIGRIENFDEDLRAIQEASGLPRTPWARRNLSRLPEHNPFAERPDLVRRLENLYREDFDIYGYQPLPA